MHVIVVKYIITYIYPYIYDDYKHMGKPVARK